MAEEKKNINNNMEGKEMSFEERQYQRLIDARNFHYENFNKWSLYFYAIIAALFVGYYNVKDNNILAVAIGLMGYIVSVCCYLSGKGYHYWEISWIRLVQAYERRLNVQLSTSRKKKMNYVYSLFVEKDKTHQPEKVLSCSNISSSKLLLFVSFCVSSSWLFLMLIELSKYFGFNFVNVNKKGLVFLYVICLLVLAVLVTYGVIRLAAKNHRLQSYMSNLDEAFGIPELKEYLK